MRQFLPFTTIIFLFSSCTTYQYMQVSGKDIQQNNRQEFVMENDSIRVKYNFSGLNAPINVEVENKMGVPVYVDWRRSALIVNNKAISYVPNSMPITGSMSASTSTWRVGNTPITSTTVGSFNGSMAIPEDMDFIPPKSYKNKTPLGVTNVFYEQPVGETKRARIQLSTHNVASVLKSDYSDSTSPFRFTSYLTLYTEGSLDKPVVYQHSFYISEIMTTILQPHNFRFINDKDGNRFYTSRANGFGKAAGGFGIVAGLALVTYGEVKAEEYNRSKGNYRNW